MRTKTYIQHSCTVHEHRLKVPLDHSRPAGETLEIFAREVVRPGGEDLPRLLFLQGGPGGPGPRLGDFRSIWIDSALKDFRVVLLDQRGTGQSTPLSAANLTGTDQEIADYLSLFMQDQIIEDAEALRRALGVQQWTTLGQSYGGFLTLAYLSLHPESLRGCLVTGGLVGLVPIDDIYRQTYPLTAVRNRAYLDRHPEDEDTIRLVAAHLRDVEEFLPTGERLTPTRLRALGQSLGMQTSFDTMHYLLEGPFVTVGGRRRLSQQFLFAVGAHLQQGDRVLYSVLQEAIYGPTTPGGTRWSAERLASEFSGFALDADPLDRSEPWYLTGEHMFRSSFAEDPGLAPLLGATDLLAARTDWPVVYRPEVLAQNSVPVAAVVYYDDMYVPRDLSLQTAEAVRGTRVWITNEYQHDGLRVGGSEVFDRLRGMLASEY